LLVCSFSFSLLILISFFPFCGHCCGSFDTHECSLLSCSIDFILCPFIFDTINEMPTRHIIIKIYFHVSHLPTCTSVFVSISKAQFYVPALF
jgi:hypothetical protein